MIQDWVHLLRRGSSYRPNTRSLGIFLNLGRLDDVNKLRLKQANKNKRQTSEMSKVRDEVEEMEEEVVLP